MADRDRREIQRRGAGGDLELEARLLRAQVRSGAVTPARLALAASVGDLAARSLAPDAPDLGLTGLPSGARQIPEAEALSWSSPAGDPFVDLVRSIGREACVRVALAAVRATWPCWEAEFHPSIAGPERGELRWGEWVLRATREWLFHPNARSVGMVRALWDDHPERVPRSTSERDALAARARMVTRGALDLTAASYVVISTPLALLLQNADIDLWPHGPAALPGLRGALRCATACAGRTPLQTALRQEVAPWALALRDPIRERLEADVSGAGGICDDALRARGEERFAARDYPRAAEAFTAACARAPHDAELRLRLAAARRHAGDPRRALGDYQRALELQPGSAAARVGLGLTRLELADFVGAAADLAQALELLAPDDRRRARVRAALDQARQRAGDTVLRWRRVTDTPPRG